MLVRSDVADRHCACLGRGVPRREGRSFRASAGQAGPPGRSAAGSRCIQGSRPRHKTNPVNRMTNPRLCAATVRKAYSTPSFVVENVTDDRSMWHDRACRCADVRSTFDRLGRLARSKSQRSLRGRRERGQLSGPFQSWTATGTCAGPEPRPLRPQDMLARRQAAFDVRAAKTASPSPARRVLTSTSASLKVRATHARAWSCAP